MFLSFLGFRKPSGCDRLNEILAFGRSRGSIGEKLGDILDFVVFLICGGVLLFIVGLKLISKAWGHIPTFCWTSLDFQKIDQI